MGKTLMWLLVIGFLGTTVWMHKSKAEVENEMPDRGTTLARVTGVPSAAQNRNEERVMMQNEEENREREGSDEAERGEGLQIRNQNAIQNMNIVAQRVQQLQQVRATGGIGDQVRQIARAQEQAQVQLQQRLDQMNSKGAVAKFFFGPDFVAIQQMQQLLEQNQERVTQLLQLQTQLTNSADQTTVSETVSALQQQNTSLQNALNNESGSFSLFGWLVKLLMK